MPGTRVHSHEKGQALVELLVVLPVLLLLLLAAADMGKLFVISGKSEIAARYSALRHFRGAPFGDIHPVHTRAVEIERIFFDGALADDPDVTYQELVHARHEVEVLRTRMLPMAEDALASTRRGFEAGRFSYISLAQAQRTLFELNERAVGAAARFHLSLVEVERLAVTVEDTTP